MNRPNFEDYKWKYKTQWNYDVARYITNIEKYCDELEQSNKSLSYAYDDCFVTYRFWEEEYYKLVKKYNLAVGVLSWCECPEGTRNCKNFKNCRECWEHFLQNEAERAKDE